MPRERFVRVPAPILYAVAFILGLTLDQVVHLQADWMRSLRPLGWIFVGVGTALGPGSVLLFALRRTTLNPAGRPSRLVTEGAFRLTRNPMYLGLAIIYSGL